MNTSEYEICVIETSQAETLDDSKLKNAEMDADSANAIFMEGLECDNPEEAIEYYSVAIYMRKDFLSALHKRAFAYYDIGDYPSALQDINRCLTLQAGDPLLIFWKRQLEKIIQSQTVGHFEIDAWIPFSEMA